MEKDKRLFRVVMQVTKQVLLATALIVTGCIILVSFGNHTSDVYTSAELQSYYRKYATHFRTRRMSCQTSLLEM